MYAIDFSEKLFVEPFYKNYTRSKLLLLLFDILWLSPKILPGNIVMSLFR